MNANKVDLWLPRRRVIRHTGVNDYAEIAEFKVTTLYREYKADQAARVVNCFIRKMIKQN